DGVAGLAADGARVAAEERVAAQMLAPFDRLEEKRFTPPTNFAIGRKGRLEIGEQAARHRHEVSLRRQLQELVSRREIDHRAISTQPRAVHQSRSAALPPFGLRQGGFKK